MRTHSDKLQQARRTCDRVIDAIAHVPACAHVGALSMMWVFMLAPMAPMVTSDDVLRSLTSEPCNWAEKMRSMHVPMRSTTCEHCWWPTMNFTECAPQIMSDSFSASGYSGHQNLSRTDVPHRGDVCHGV